MKITHASTLSDSALIAELSRLAGRERAAVVALIVHLAEFDARRLYAGEGYPRPSAIAPTRFVSPKRPSGTASKSRGRRGIIRSCWTCSYPER
jgi:hypothetical protein